MPTQKRLSFDLLQDDAAVSEVHEQKLAAGDLDAIAFIKGMSPVAWQQINQTAKKLGVSFYAYVFDRVSGAFNLPSLADLITLKARSLAI